jgi:hypothetical protein
LLKLNQLEFIHIIDTYSLWICFTMSRLRRMWQIQSAISLYLMVNHVLNKFWGY